MVWHIFKKDWKLLWVFVITVASLHWIAAFIMFKLGLFGEDATLEVLSETIPILAFFGSMFLIVAIVHIEAIPGTRQDWLARPIPRGSLLFEKLLFVVIMVEGPIFAANLFQGIANGFSLWLSFVSATSFIIFLLFFLILPLFSFASVTKNMTEAFIFGCGCTFIIGAFLTLGDYMNASAHGTLITVTHSGIGWIGVAFRFALVALAAGVILGLQYFRRKTAMARVLMIAFGLLILTSQFLPWKSAFAIEEWLSPKRSAGAGTEVAFNPGAGKFKSPSGLVGASENRQPRGGGDTAVMSVPFQSAGEVFLPLQVAGVRNDAILLTDRVDVQLIGQDRRVIYHGTGDSFEITGHEPKPGEASAYQKIAVPMAVYLKAKDGPVQLQVDYSLTSFGLARSFSLPALDGAEQMPGWGWCKTKMNEAGTAVELRCMEPGKGPICGTAFLENASVGVQNPVQSSCHSDYGPTRGQPLPDNFSRFGTNLPFRDPSGLAKFPVDGSKLPQSRVVIRMYEPEEHFTRSLMIPQIKLRDWEAQ
jgi:hypothetical protein